MIIYKLKIISHIYIFIVSIISVIIILTLSNYNNFALDFWFILLIIILNELIIFRLFTGILEFRLINDVLELNWIRKPLITLIKNQRINFIDIMKWNFDGHSDYFYIKLKSKKRIFLYFKFFAIKNNYHAFIKDFEKWINGNNELFILNSSEMETLAVNSTEEFYNSWRWKLLSTLVFGFLIVDIILIILNAWNSRTILIGALIPIFIIFMGQVIAFLIHNKNHNIKKENF